MPSIVAIQRELVRNAGCANSARSARAQDVLVVAARDQQDVGDVAGTADDPVARIGRIAPRDVPAAGPQQRAHHRHPPRVASRAAAGGAKPPDLVDTNTNIGFSYEGLRKLAGASADEFSDEAFRLGLPERAGSAQTARCSFSYLCGALAPSAPRAALLREEAEKRGVVKMWEEVGLVRRDLPGHEHFGFDDGISQPGPRGTLSDIPDDYLTPRYIDSSQSVEALLYGLPGQDLVWPGEFVFGYPGQGPDPLVAGR
jgi:hypothetical protein